MKVGIKNECIGWNGDNSRKSRYFEYSCSITHFLWLENQNYASWNVFCYFTCEQQGIITFIILLFFSFSIRLMFYYCRVTDQLLLHLNCLKKYTKKESASRPLWSLSLLIMPLLNFWYLFFTFIIILILLSCNYVFFLIFIID